MDPKNITTSGVPIVLRNTIKWSILDWDWKDWKNFLERDDENRHFNFRKGNQCCSMEPLWERKCETVNMALKDFFDNHITREEEESKNWLYFDYKHLAEFFSSKTEKMDISWADFGHPEKSAKDSTLWIGSKGAHTPCHFDTYGCNIVAQLRGRKRWILFPPQESNNLKPTRVPYEESSVYSSISFSCGCSDIAGIKEVRMVILNPGDVLFVPLHWWHYVENLSSAISVNVWLSNVSDNVSRLEESLVKYFISSVCRTMEDDPKHILNPNEDDIPSLRETYNMEELLWCVKHITDPSENKEDECEWENSFFQVPQISPEELSTILKLKCTNNEQLLVSDNNERSNLRTSLIKAFCHPDVISLVREKLLNYLE